MAKHRFSVSKMSFLLVAAASLLAGCGKAGPKSEAASAPAAAAGAESPGDPSQAFLALVDHQARDFLQTAPEAATELGVSEEIAGEGFLSRLGNYGFEAQQSARAMNEEFLQEIRAVDRDKLEGVAAVTYDVLKNAYDAAARRNQFHFGGSTPFGSGLPNSGDSWAESPYFMTQLTGPHIAIARMLMTQHPIDSKQHIEDYIDRLNDMGRALDGAGETIATDADLGFAPPSFAVEGIATSIDSFIAPPPSQNPLVTSLRERMEKVEGLTADERDDYKARAAKAVEDVIYPAYQRLASHVAAMRDKTNDEAGVWRLGEEGDAFYHMALAAYGAGGMTGEEVHELGLKEVDRITGEMDALLKEIGLADGSVGERMKKLGERPSDLYPDTDEGREALLEDLRGYVADIMAKAPQWFGRLPKAGVEVKRIPVHEQDSSPGGYYTAGSLDGARPGAYWINLKNTADNPKHTLKSLTFHEAVPGHHFQVSFQRSIKGMPLMRNMLGYSEYAEGWALYAEKLAKEMGMYEGDPEGDLGRLQAELFRAARLVVDTGIHAKHWTRDEAIDYMTGVTGDTRASIAREVERYAVVPGQACAYKLGMLKIEALRNEAETELGDKFDIKEFHDVVLSIGDSPLPVLEKTVDEWLAAKKG